MITVLCESGEIRVPEWVVGLESFRRWAATDNLPEKTRVWYLKGEVWIDLSKEQLFTHVGVKTALHTVLGRLTKEENLGLYLVDGVFITNAKADLAGNPDAAFASAEALRAGQVRLVDDYREVEGSPDMVLGVVSRNSAHKDTVQLRQAYWEAGVREYWLVDARKEPLRFDILRHTARGFVATRKRDGWIKSAVFGKSFRLTQDANGLGHPYYTLEVR
jgi:Uma2 family endonuclease